MTPRRIAALIVVAALVMVASASTADTLTLTLVSQNNTTITLGWTPQSGYGYLFSADGQLVSRTNDASRSTVKFSKSFSAYEVAVIVKGATGTYPTAPPPPPTAQCADGVDNDGDGKIDLADPGCSSPTDNDEADQAPPGTTLTAAQFEQRCNTAGAVIDTVSVTAAVSVSCAAQNVTVRNSRITGIVVNIEPAATGFRFDNTDIANGGFNIWGADNVTIANGAFDGGGNESSNQMWDKPAGNGPQHIVIRGNSFSNYRGATCDTHGEALFVGGYSNDVLIDGNTFSQNGCTSHIFFSYFGNDALSGYRSAQVPRNVCVRGNTFGPRYLQTYFDVNFRSEVASVGPAATGIKVQTDAVTTNPEFNASC